MVFVRRDFFVAGNQLFLLFGNLVRPGLQDGGAGSLDAGCGLFTFGRRVYIGIDFRRCTDKAKGGGDALVRFVDLRQ